MRRDRVFHTFRRWPLVPTEDLVKLRQSLREVQELGGPTAAGELLGLVDHEPSARSHRAMGVYVRANLGPEYRPVRIWPGTSDRPHSVVPTTDRRP